MSKGSAPLSEPICIPEVYIDGIARIEQMGPNLKLDFFSYQRPVCGGDHALERVIVARFVMPIEAVAAASLEAMTAADASVILDKTH